MNNDIISTLLKTVTWLTEYDHVTHSASWNSPAGPTVETLCLYPLLRSAVAVHVTLRWSVPGRDLYEHIIKVWIDVIIVHTCISLTQTMCIRNSCYTIVCSNLQTFVWCHQFRHCTDWPSCPTTHWLLDYHLSSNQRLSPGTCDHAARSLADESRDGHHGDRLYVHKYERSNGERALNITPKYMLRHSCRKFIKETVQALIDITSQKLYSFKGIAQKFTDI